MRTLNGSVDMLCANNNDTRKINIYRCCCCADDMAAHLRFDIHAMMYHTAVRM